MWNVHSVLSVHHIFRVSNIGLKRRYPPGQFLPNTLPDYLLVGCCVSFWLCLPAPYILEVHLQSIPDLPSVPIVTSQALC